jgi:lipopolysaccharide biosynthesis glycosyltransferase
VFQWTEPVVIVSGCDDAFAFPLAVALSSALRNLRAGQAAQVYVLNDGITTAKRMRIERVVQAARAEAQFHWVEADMLPVRHLPTSKQYSRAMYLRLLIPDLLPQHQRAIYLDSDLIVERDLAELWDMPLGDAFCLAVENYTDPTVATALRHVVQEPKIDPNIPYLNSGVLLMNLHRWRDEQMTAQVIGVLEQYHSEFLFPDQDAISVALAGRWLKLDPRWNVQQSTLADYGPRRHMSAADSAAFQAKVANNPFIMHFTGTRKPWHHRYRGVTNDRFLHYVARSGWFAPPAGALWVASRRLSHGVWKRLSQLKQARQRTRGLQQGTPG